MWLQWSRDLEVAERGSQLLPGVLRHQASMEPRLGSRGKTFFPDVTDYSYTLQWSRDLEVAERQKEFSELIRETNRFNGAATWKSRKAHAWPASVNRQPRLQWSRDLEVAERSPMYLSDMVTLSLQWSRDLEVAERSPSQLLS